MKFEGIISPEQLSAKNKIEIHISMKYEGIISSAQPSASYCCCCRWHNSKSGRKPVKLQKESPAGCAGEGKQNKGK